MDVIVARAGQSASSTKRSPAPMKEGDKLYVKPEDRVRIWRFSV
jgi:hypothetical protein